MDWGMTVPCDNCPFRKEGGIRLHPVRARQLADMMLDSQGATFTCHKTTASDERDDNADEDGFIPQEHHKHCAGALIFAEKNSNATQMMRISERFGDYDPKKLMSNEEAVASVFDTKSQMVRANKS